MNVDTLPALKDEVLRNFFDKENNSEFERAIKIIMERKIFYIF